MDNLVTVLGGFQAQSKNALRQVFLLAGKNNLLRIDVPESDTLIELDDSARAISELPQVARSLVEASGQTVFKKFLSEPIAAYKRYND